MKQKVLSLVIFITAVLAAQPELDIKPNKIEFEDLFSRIDYTYLINKGNAVLTIDSIDYNRSDYILDFEENQQIPFTILPNDSVKMNVTLVGFYYITYSDTSDTMFVYNNGINNVEELKVEIEFYEDDFGFVVGTVRDSLTPLDSTSIYFFYNGIYLIDKAITDASGNYQVELPEGDYTIAAERNGYLCFV
ncbi:MAG: carboxypeptidase-like regulatory domain-containing protein [Ignavibacteriaceae bacterium]|nr:carboxypeptidase-like regulatory domain-containing protein [Ignavibacteriaceae bacterium]